MKSYVGHCIVNLCFSYSYTSLLQHLTLRLDSDSRLPHDICLTPTHSQLMVSNKECVVLTTDVGVSTPRILCHDSLCFFLLTKKSVKVAVLFQTSIVFFRPGEIICLAGICD